MISRYMETLQQVRNLNLNDMQTIDAVAVITVTLIFLILSSYIFKSKKK